MEALQAGAVTVLDQPLRPGDSIHTPAVQELLTQGEKLVAAVNIRSFHVAGDVFGHQIVDRLLAAGHPDFFVPTPRQLRARAHVPDLLRG